MHPIIKLGPVVVHTNQNRSIVAISGYMGHPLGSFKQKDGEFMWLKDELPDDIPTARIFTYGYYFANACRTLAPEGLFDQEEGLSRIIAHLGSDFVEALHSIRSGMVITNRFTNTILSNFNLYAVSRNRKTIGTHWPQYRWNHN